MEIHTHVHACVCELYMYPSTCFWLGEQIYLFDPYTLVYCMYIVWGKVDMYVATVCYAYNVPCIEL